jgi:hypothetical protein
MEVLENLFRTTFVFHTFYHTLDCANTSNVTVASSLRDGLGRANTTVHRDESVVFPETTLPPQRLLLLHRYCLLVVA